MLVDSLLLFDPAATAITVTAASTNVLDMVGTGLPASPQGSDIGQVSDLVARISVQQAFTAAGAATLQVQLQAAPDNAGSPGTYIILAQTDAIPKASLVAGAFIDLPIPPLPPQGETSPPFEAPANVPRFYRLNYVVATGPMTAGQVESFLTSREAADLGAAILYKNNFTVV